MSAPSPRSPQSDQAFAAPCAEAHRLRNARRGGRGSWTRGRWTLLLLALVCAAPVAGAYLAYYVFKPAGAMSNYGTLIEPQRPLPAATVTGADGQPVTLASLRGRWLLVTVAPSACDTACATRLYFIRQVRATQGAERGRIVEVWLRTDADPVPAVIRAAYPDTRMLIADPAVLARWLPVNAGTTLQDHVFVVDPNGNLMMRFPENPDPGRIKGDVTKLLKWSGIG